MAKKLTPEEREEAIGHLTGNCDCGMEPVFNEDNTDMLEKMTDAQLLLLVENSKAMMVEENEEEEMESDEEMEMEMEDEEEMVPAPRMKRKPVANSYTFNESDLPEEVKEDLKFARNMRQQQKDGLITKITTNKSGLFSAKELQSKSIDELTKIASYVGNASSAPEKKFGKAVPRIGGHRPAPINNQSGNDEDEILELPVMNYGTDN